VRTLGSPSSNFTAAVGSPTWANQPAAAVTAFLNVWATSATVAWDANVNPAGTVYQVQASTTGFSTIIASAQGTATSATLTGLAPNQTNAFRVRAVNHANVPTAYLTIGSTVTQAAVPTLTLFTITTNTITAFWNANGNPAGTLYVASNTTAGTGSGATPATFWQSTGLSINSSYTFVARAINSSGDPTVYNTLGTRYTYAQTPGAAVNLGQSANQLRVGVSTGANPANTEYAIKVEDITGALISNPLVYYVQTPDGSNQSLLTGLMNQEPTIGEGRVVLSFKTPRSRRTGSTGSPSSLATEITSKLLMVRRFPWTRRPASRSFRSPGRFRAIGSIRLPSVSRPPGLSIITISSRRTATRWRPLRTPAGTAVSKAEPRCIRRTATRTIPEN
jgi:hypothetical protein